MALGRQFGREASIYLVGFVGVGLVGFIALPIYSRVLGPAQYGLFSLTTATTTVLAGVMVVGGDVALARFWVDAKTEAAKRQLASTWIAFLTAWSIVIAAVAMLATPFLADAMRPGTDFATLLLVGFAAMVPTQLSRMLAQVLRNSFRPVAYSTVLIINALLDVAFGLLFGIVLDLGVVGILLGILLGETCGALIRLPFVKRYLGLNFDWSLLPPLLRFGVPFIPASLAAWTFRGADRLVLSSHVSAAELGHYGLAISLIAPFAIVSMAMGQAWIPRIAQMEVEDRATASRAVSAAIGASTAALGAAAMLAGALAPLAVRIVGGPSYAASAQPLPYLALGSALAGMTSFLGTGLMLMKATRIIPLITILAAVLDLCLLLLLIPHFGLVGAALASAVAYLALGLATLHFSDRVYPIRLQLTDLGLILLILAAQATLCTFRPAEALVWVGTLLGMLAVAILARHNMRVANAV